MAIIPADIMRYTVVRDLGRGTTLPVTADVPGGLQTGDRFYHSGASLRVVYVSPNWLTIFEYSQDLTPYGRTAQPYSGAATTLLIGPTRTDLGAFVTRVKVYADVATTNNASNYWSLAVKYAGTSVYTFNTSADSAGAQINEEDAPNVAVASPGAFSTLDITGKTGAPGSIVANCAIWFRLILV